MIEEWKRIKDYEDYEISNFGRIKSYKQDKNGKITLGNKDKKGYLTKTLYNKDGCKTFKVHRLVAQAFIPNPNNLPEVNHKDGNHSNNSVYNLEWCTREYNQRHAIKNNLYKIEEDSPRAKLTKEQVISIYKEWETNKNKKAISRKYNVSDALIGEIVRGVRWSRTFEEYYGYKSSYIKPKRKRLSEEQIYSILTLHYIHHKNTIEIEKELNISNGYIGQIIRGIRYPEYYRKFMQEINISLDNQQPNPRVIGEVQRL